MNTQNPTMRRVVAGAIYDFAARLTCRDKPITLGSRHDAAPAAEACQEFLQLRNCNDGEPMVKDWQERLADPVITKRELEFALNYHGDDARINAADHEIATRYFAVVEANRGTHPSLGGPDPFKT